KMMSSKIPVLSTTVMRGVLVSKFGDPDVLEVRRDLPIPKTQANEVLVKVAAVGVNPVDTYIRAGKYARLPNLPYVPGNDMCGTVVFAGADVTSIKEGDRVASFMHVKSGAYAEYCVVNADWLVRLPENFDFLKGAAVGTPYFTAYRALFTKAKATPSDIVLVHGASGGVGVAACQFAISQGITVYGTAGSEEGMKVVRSAGAKDAFNHREEGYTAKIMKATGGKGPDIIIEMLSNVNLNKDLEMLAPRGKIVIVGCRGPIEINPRLLMGKESCIEGVGLFATPQEDFSNMSKIITAGLKQGWLDPAIGVQFSLNSVQQAHKELIHNKGSKGKMVLIL
uniref:Enoyl reductase (ER) domain-containing protein n=1 Tax=Ciona savignyi TaxID=51511 RepID=H2Z2F4_CIOSA